MEPSGLPKHLRTERLLLRQWRPADREAFAAINADPAVMRHIGSGPLDRAGSDALWAQLCRDWSDRGHAPWAVERADDGALLGFCGLAIPTFLPQVLPAVEIGWRLRRDAWGYGYATEAALAALDAAWHRMGMAQIVAIVHPDNERSLALADRLGMRVTNRTRHAPTGWDVLVLRVDRPVEPEPLVGRLAPVRPAAVAEPR